MGLLYNNLFLLNEVEVNGEDQSGGDDSGATDYTADSGDNSGDNADNDSTNGTDNDDASSDSDDANNDDIGEDTETTDYTDMGDDDSGDSDAGGDESGDSSNDSSSSSDSDVDEPVDDLKKKEEELYGNLSTEELDIKHKELKNQFIEMYDVVTDLISKIGDAAISEENIGTVEFVTEELSKLQVMIADYLTNVYAIKSYIENSVNYNRFLAVLNGINKILDELNESNKKTNINYEIK